MRLFIAVNIPPATRDALYADAVPLRGATNAVKWVAAPALHVTLKFLGERDERLVGDITQALEAMAQRHDAFEAWTTDVGAFPNFGRPRVVWLGMTGETAFRAIARDIDLELAPLGIPAESRVFQAHLTLGRVKGEMRADHARAMTAALEVSRPARSFPVQSVDLMRSELGPGGSRYSVLAAVPLRTRGS